MATVGKRTKRQGLGDWTRAPERAELLALYREADALVEGWTCTCSEASGRSGSECCHFAVIGREPYPTSIELEEVRYAMRVAGASPRDPRRLPIANRPCPLLGVDGHCRIYPSRPLGCRTFFCERAEGPVGGRSKVPREALNSIGRRIADLSARFAPRDPHPRPITGALWRANRSGA